MKRAWVIVTNVFLMVAMVGFVVLYSHFEGENAITRQIEHFETNTIAMEHVTENYLEGEQRICDVWAHYINRYKYYSEEEIMTMEEAIDYIRVSHALPTASAHIVFQIHDELILECPEENGERVRARLKYIMEHSVDTLGINLPMKCDMVIEHRWGETDMALELRSEYQSLLDDGVVDPFGALVAKYPEFPAESVRKVIENPEAKLEF